MIGFYIYLFAILSPFSITLSFSIFIIFVLLRYAIIGSKNSEKEESPKSFYGTYGTPKNYPTMSQSQLIELRKRIYETAARGSAARRLMQQR